MSANPPPLPRGRRMGSGVINGKLIELFMHDDAAMTAYATAAISAQAAELEALRDELRLCCELKREYQEQVASKVDEVEALRAKVAEWEKLRDPVTLHVSLLRGFPARLSRAVFLHLAGDEWAKF